MVNGQGEILVLLIEDSQLIQTDMKELLHPSAQVIAALTPDEARQRFQENSKNLDLIVVDGELKVTPTKTEETCPLIRWIRGQGYTGLMVASSGIPSLRQKQVKAGCDLELEKYGLPYFVERQFCVPITADPLHC